MTRSQKLPDFIDKNAILLLLKRHLIEYGKSGFYYKPDWSDLLIAQAIHPLFKAHHTATVRRAKFGKLVPPPEPTPATPSRMDIIETRIARIIDHLAGNSPRTAQFRRYLLDGPSSTAHLDDI